MFFFESKGSRVGSAGSALPGATSHPLPSGSGPVACAHPGRLWHELQADRGLSIRRPQG